MTQDRNKLIARFMGVCTSTSFSKRIVDLAGEVYVCDECGERTSHHIDIPLYDSADSPRRLLGEAEAKCIEKVGLWNFASKLWLPMREDILRQQFALQAQGYESAEEAFYKHGRFAIATAEQRVDAIIAAIGLEVKGK